MNCLIDNAIKFSLKQGTKAETIRQYILTKYRINIDKAALKERIRILRGEMELT